MTPGSARQYETRFRALNRIYQSIVEEFESEFVHSQQTDPYAWMTGYDIGFFK